MKKVTIYSNNPEKSYTEKKLGMSLVVGRYIQDVHLIKKKINLITIEEKILNESKEKALEIINREEREMVPLTYEENNFYND